MNNTNTNDNVNQKEHFINNVKKWSLIEAKLKDINEHSKKLREAKNNLSESICQYMSDNNLADKKIAIPQGELKMVQKKEYTPLTFSYIEVCLDNIIDNKEQVQSIMAYIREQRELTIATELRRFNK
jgi:hypothetical protein